MIFNLKKEGNFKNFNLFYQKSTMIRFFRINLKFLKIVFDFGQKIKAVKIFYKKYFKKRHFCV